MIDPGRKNRADRLRSNVDRLLAREALTKEQLAALETEVGQAKYRLSLKDDVERAMVAVQERNHQRTVGMYEGLLTEIYREIIGKDKSVSIDLYLHGGRPAMDISMDNQGRTESVLNGSGGAVANALSVGLRFIALSRIDRRKFIVLDEADCWLASERVPYFANVVAKLGRDLGFQSLMISHHPQSYFYEAASTIIQLAPGDEGVSARMLKQTPDGERPDEIALIRLQNFMSHADTEIRMGSGLTILQAENDVGKSAVVTAIEAITTGSFKKEYIRHDCDFSEVEMVFTDGRSLVCRRVAKTTRNDKYAVAYQLRDASGSLVREEPLKDDVPDWAMAMMRIAPEQGLDIQIGNQKQPVFLLAEPASKRAGILSIGGEISHIAAMQANYKEKVARDRRAVTEGEASVGAMRKTLEALSGIDAMSAELAILSAERNDIDQRAAMVAQMSTLIQRLQVLESRCVTLPPAPADIAIADPVPLDRLIAALSAPELSIPAVPDLPDIQDAPFERLIRALSAPELEMPEAPSLPEIADLSAIDRLISGGRLVGTDIQVPSIETLSAVPEPADIAAMSELVDRFARIREEGRSLQARSGEIEQELQDAVHAINEAIEASGGICEACGQSIPPMEESHAPSC